MPSKRRGEQKKHEKFLRDHARCMKAIVDGAPIPPEVGYVLAGTGGAGRAKKAWKPAKPSRSFYKSKEWAEARYDALQRHGGKCQACGRTAADGIKINVDHIEPISKAWGKRLDQGNLQVLCGQCNRGKGARDATDWRPAA